MPGTARVVGCAPVPNARPGSSVMFSASASRRRRTTSGRSTGRPRCGSAGTAPASRAPSPGRRPRRFVRRDAAPASAARRAPATAAASASAANSAVKPRDRPPLRRRHRRRSSNTGVSPAVPARGSAASTDSAPASSSASDHASASAASTSKRRQRIDGTPQLATCEARATSATPPASAWRGAPRDSGSTCRRAGISRRAAAPGAAECSS